MSNFLEQRAMSKITSGQNAVCWFDTDPGPQSFVYCPVDNTLFEVVQKSAVQLCRVSTVVTETTQLVLSKFKTIYSSRLRIE